MAIPNAPHMLANRANRHSFQRAVAEGQREDVRRANEELRKTEGELSQIEAELLSFGLLPSDIDALRAVNYVGFESLAWAENLIREASTRSMQTPTDPGWFCRPCFSIHPHGSTCPNEQQVQASTAPQEAGARVLVEGDLHLAGLSESVSIDLAKQLAETIRSVGAEVSMAVAKLEEIRAEQEKYMEDVVQKLKIMIKMGNL